MRLAKKYFVTGGAGFIGAHLVNHLLDDSDVESVVVYDNFSNGRRWAFGDRVSDPRLTVVEADVKELEPLREAMRGAEVVFHFAANADIARAADEPSIDFWIGTYLTHNVLEAMREEGVKRIFYTSGSGVYGEMGSDPAAEDFPGMTPISTYGASKLGSEALVSAYAHMFDMTGTVFRFANVVGPHQTHGVSYDFICRLNDTPDRLKIFGDGKQSKPYIYIEDILKAFDLLEEIQREGFDVMNVGSEDHITVTEIADVIVEAMELSDVAYDYTGGSRGWKADVPIYRLDTSKIRSKGWSNDRNSREAVDASVRSMLTDLAEGVLQKRGDA